MSLRSRKKDKAWGESAVLNNANYIQYQNRLTELSISMFDWQNLPATVNARFLELALFSKGMCVFFKDEVIGYLCLHCAINGRLDVYGIPMKRRAFSVNGYQRELDEQDSVIIYNNMLHTNSVLDVEMFAKRLYNLDRAIDVNANAQKTPILIKCDENERLTMKNVYMQYDGNMPVIFGSKALNANNFEVLKTDAPYVADKLYTLKSQIWNEALTYLGISNTNITKKERMISDEVMRNMGGVIASRQSRLETRRTACKMINRMFDLDLWVDYREDYREMDDELMLAGETGGFNVTSAVKDLRTNTNVPFQKLEGLIKKEGEKHT